MIVNHLSRLMGERRLNIRDVSKLSGVTYASVLDLYHDRAARFDRLTLDRLCRALGVPLCRVLEYVPDETPASTGAAE
jgi:putative transcriptional regulator